MIYTIDIYRRQLDLCDSCWQFPLFVSFFPQLVVFAWVFYRAKSYDHAVEILAQLAKLTPGSATTTATARSARHRRLH